MREQWYDIKDFPPYQISNRGEVKNGVTDRILKVSQNQSGVAYVGMMKDGVQVHRGIALMVIEACGFQHVNEVFDTPINLDGNRLNNHISNLMWRPRWYAVKYHRQFEKRYAYPIVTPVIDTGTMTIYQNSMHAAVSNGLLEKEVVMSIANNTHTWPTHQVFQMIPE
jgi:hypothetical protein